MLFTQLQHLVLKFAPSRLDVGSNSRSARLQNLRRYIQSTRVGRLNEQNEPILQVRHNPTEECGFTMVFPYSPIAYFEAMCSWQARMDNGN